jgi:FkbM family methyltransferase
MESNSHVIIPLSNGLKLALCSRQQMGCARFIIKEIFKNQTYRRPGFELLPTDTVVDLGGNMGLFSLWAAPQAARVISIEPTKVIDCLEQSLALNGIQNVSIVRCAVSDKPGTLELLQYPGFNAVSHAASFQPARWGQWLIKLLWPKEREEPIRVSCPCYTLDDILRTQNIDRVDFLKVDCEGGEYAVFDSISDETLGRISRIALEFHEIHPSHNHRRIVNRLKSAGFEVTVERTLLDRFLLQTGMLWAKRVVQHQTIQNTTSALEPREAPHAA